MVITFLPVLIPAFVINIFTVFCSFHRMVQFCTFHRIKQIFRRIIPKLARKSIYIFLAAFLLDNKTTANLFIDKY